MKTQTLTYLTDPSHGWLVVKRSDLITLGIEDQITGFSYEHGAKVYLEEDCDLMTYLRAATAAGWFVKTKGQHMMIEDDMPQLIAAMHLHTFRCECDFCEFWATTGLS